MPRISIVTPTYGQAATIRQTIESVLGQEGVDLEYWVLDAGSRDGTVEILRSYESDPRFHWISEPDHGQSDAINKGLARCTGDVFNWLNSDDYLEPGALRIVSDAFEKNPGLDIVSGKTTEFRGEPPEIFNRIQLQMRDTAEQTMCVGVYCQPSTFWRTEIVHALGDIDASLCCVMDWHLWLRYLAQHGQEKVFLVDDVLAHFRHHAEAKTSALSERFYEESRMVTHDLHTSMNAPEEFLLPESAKPDRVCTAFQFGPQFERERYLGSYAEKMVRTYRRKNPALAKVWLKRAWSYPPGTTLWRLKIAMRLLFK